MVRFMAGDGKRTVVVVRPRQVDTEDIMGNVL